ncbi:hypothetical protein IFM89_018272 [Coptis chinensis]|uniref:BHLH domain-containing protein n=1 Tax=Coptis chinensis TaxID=261450 RepID=A0A835ID42_9MAGN|nr:hypothetical protein IFM89_018272 [Coptis chinensis]
MVPDINKTTSEESGDDYDESTQTDITQQLQRLQSLIPNSSKNDTISILEEARDYIQSIHQETEIITKELSQRSLDNLSPSSSSQSSDPNLQRAQIQKVEVEKLMDRRFVVKISWRGGHGGTDVQRVIECLDVKMTSIAPRQTDSDEMLSTAFIKVSRSLPGSPSLVCM